MKTKYKYIHFEELKTLNVSYWACVNNSTRLSLGHIEWYPRWKQWQYVPAENTAYTEDCLLDIADFMSQLENPK